MTHSRRIAQSNRLHNARFDDEVMTDIDLADDLDQLPSFGLRPNAALQATANGVPVLDVVIPVYNEQVALADSVRRLHRNLTDTFPYTVRITIADNASTDETPRIAAELAEELAAVRVVRIEQKGRGLALHEVWSQSDAAVLAYMDVDLSTDLAALAPTPQRAAAAVSAPTKAGCCARPR